MPSINMWAPYPSSMTSAIWGGYNNYNDYVPFSGGLNVAEILKWASGHIPRALTAGSSLGTEGSMSPLGKDAPPMAENTDAISVISGKEVNDFYRPKQQPSQTQPPEVQKERPATPEPQAPNAVDDESKMSAFDVWKRRQAEWQQEQYLKSLGLGNTNSALQALLGMKRGGFSWENMDQLI